MIMKSYVTSNIKIFRSLRGMAKYCGDQLAKFVKKDIAKITISNIQPLSKTLNCRE